MKIFNLAVLAVLLALLSGCMDVSERRKECTDKGGELVKVHGAKTSHWECVKRIPLS